MACPRTLLIVLSTLVLFVPAAAHARREPGPGDAPAAAQPVAPAAPAPGTVPVVVTPAPADGPVAAAPVPAPVLPASMHGANVSAPAAAPRNKAGNWAILTGTTLFAATYFYTSALGAIAIDKGRKSGIDPTTGLPRTSDTRRIAFGRRMLIPVVGPFMAIGHTNHAFKRWGASISGVLQLGSVALVVTGIVLKSRAARERRFGWTAGATRDGGGIAIHGRF